jgi:hypothetical protein
MLRAACVAKIQSATHMRVKRYRLTTSMLHGRSASSYRRRLCATKLFALERSRDSTDTAYATASN